MIRTWKSGPNHVTLTTSTDPQWQTTKAISTEYALHYTSHGHGLSFLPTLVMTLKPSTPTTETLWSLCLQGKVDVVSCWIAKQSNGQEIANTLILHAEACCIQVDDIFGDMFDMFVRHKVLDALKLGERLKSRAKSDKESLEQNLEHRWGQRWWTSFGIKHVPSRGILLAMRRMSRTDTLPQACARVADCLKDHPTASGRAILGTYQLAGDRVMDERLASAERSLSHAEFGSDPDHTLARMGHKRRIDEADDGDDAGQDDQDDDQDDDGDDGDDAGQDDRADEGVDAGQDERVDKGNGADENDAMDVDAQLAEVDADVDMENTAETRGYKLHHRQLPPRTLIRLLLCCTHRNQPFLRSGPTPPRASYPLA